MKKRQKTKGQLRGKAVIKTAIAIGAAAVTEKEAVKEEKGEI